MTQIKLEAQAEPLKVIVVGGGISGLTAALGLRKQGHQVTIFERSKLAKEVGAAIHIAPNAHGILKRLGVFPETFGANPVKGMAEYDAKGQLRFRIDLQKSLKIWQHSWVLSHRVQLHDNLLQHATDPNGEGPPAILETSKKIIHVDPEAASVTLEDGTVVSGDLILGADGVSSVSREAVVGKELKPFGSGKSAFRFMIPCADILRNDTTRELFFEGHMTIWMGDDRRLVMYPCSDNTVMNFVGIHPSQLSAANGREWGQKASKEVLLQVYKDFGPVVQELLSLTDDSSLQIWTLLDMARIPHWTKGYVALMGDAAHPFLPHQGQGGGVAMEDAASLISLLPKGTLRSDIKERLGLYEKLRDERAHKIQEFTRQAGMDLTKENRESFNIMEFVNYNFGHDEFDHSTHALRVLLSSKNNQVHLRQPIAFGPLPSPRQDHVGRAFGSHDAKFSTFSVRFQTSATYLKTLFPTESFSFQSPGTTAQATWMCTQLDNLEWLGGSGYRFLGLWIHDVQYTKLDGSKVYGSYLPLLFENNCDPILTGRDELGMPKLYCDIDINKESTLTTITCSRGSIEFIRLELHSLEEGRIDSMDSQNETTAQSPKDGLPKDDGQLVYRYVPTVGKPGVADAAYPVFLSNSGATTPRVVETTKRGNPAQSIIRLSEKSSRELPTLHSISSSLASIPVYQVLDVKEEAGRGVDDLRHAQRIE